MTANNIENATYIAELNEALPQGVHSVGITDEHLTLIKSCIKATLLGSTSDPWDTPLRVGPRALNALSDTLNLSSYVTLDTEQTISGRKTFSDWIVATTGLQGPASLNLIADIAGFTAVGNDSRTLALQAPGRDGILASYGDSSEVVLHTGNALTLLIDSIYPVGSIYYSALPTNPGSYWPGTTWEAGAQGRVIMGVGTGTDKDGTSFTVGQENINVGGYEVQLTEANLPPHNHDITLNPSGGSIANNGGDIFQTAVDQAPGGALRAGGETRSTGSAQKFVNLPPAVGVYIWVRTL